MMIAQRRLGCFVFLLATAVTVPAGQQAPVPANSPQPSVQPAPEAAAEYVLGPDDQIKVWALGMDEIPAEPIRIDVNGFIDLPMVGRVRAGGLTVEQLKARLCERLAAEVLEPKVSVEIFEFGSQPVSVLGAVASPGVHQLRGRKTLIEVLSLAGGLRADAGHSIKISRLIERGTIPLSTASVDPRGKFSVAEVRIKDVLEAKNPAENILIRAHDVITVPSADMIYVIGAVRKPGAFVLHEQETVSVLQALSMAEGLGSTPSPQNSRILRPPPGSSQRIEIAVDLKKVLAGKAEDVHLQPNDILFVPTSTSRRIVTRALEAAIATGTGIIIWRR